MLPFPKVIYRLKKAVLSPEVGKLLVGYDFITTTPYSSTF